jgi:hypothetical protein
VFILGHYRSGTTLVHKLLAADSRFGSVRTFDLLFPACPPFLTRLLEPVVQGFADLTETRQPFFHDYRLRLDDPNELEPLMLALGSEWSSYWGYLFPRRADEYLARHLRFPTSGAREAWKEAYLAHVVRLSHRFQERPLVIKDPPNTGRVEILLELFPKARFIHVVRHPVQAFFSMRRLWRDTILRRYALQEIQPEERDGIILRHYLDLLSLWKRQAPLIPSGQLVEVRYETLIEDPVGVIRDVYEDLGLPSFRVAEKDVAQRWAEDRTYTSNPEEPDAETLLWITEEMKEWTSWLGYG